MRQQMKLLRERWKNGISGVTYPYGISTGYCHVGNYGAAHRMALYDCGSRCYLAARLQYAAEIDEILIADETYKLIRSEFLCVPKTPIYLKGFQNPSVLGKLWKNSRYIGLSISNGLIMNIKDFI